MRRYLRLHVDDRGISRALVDHWLPQLDTDVVWLVGGDPTLESGTQDVVPFVTMTAWELKSVIAEAAEDQLRVLAIFGSLEELLRAAELGLSPQKVVIQHLSDGPGRERIAPEVFVGAATREVVCALERLGFTFEIQPLPVVTARPWSLLPHALRD